jgi:transaldolase
MNPLQSLRVKLFADGADKAGMLELYRNPLIKGMTTNPTLMKKAGIRDYERFAREVLETVTDKPISFEVFADEFPEMRRQALRMRDWQQNVFVKIPVSNVRGESAFDLIRDLAQDGVKLNVTAILTERQIARVADALDPWAPSVVSVFAGRIADTGRDPVPVMRWAADLLRHIPTAELLWASVREVLNIYQADGCGTQIVTVPHDILRKAIELANYNLEQLSVETVQMFDRDAKAAGFSLAEPLRLPKAGDAPAPLKVAA